MGQEPEVAREGLGKRLRRSFKTARRWCIAQAARFGIFAMGSLPFSITRRVFPALTGLFARPMIRRKVHAHLDHAYDSAMSTADKNAVTKQIARNMGLVVAEVLALDRGKLPEGYLDLEQALATVGDTVEGEHGFIALTGHLGNWEFLGWLLHSRWPDRTAAVIAKRNTNPFLNSMIEKTRQRLGMVTIYQDDSPRKSLRFLREGKIIGTVPDQDIPRIAGTFVPFFGKPAYTPTGPAALAYLAGVPICCGFTKRTATGLELVCPPPIWPNCDAPKEAEIERMTALWTAQLEAQIREQPADWMWFHERWRTTPERLEARRERKRREAR